MKAYREKGNLYLEKILKAKSFLQKYMKFNVTFNYKTSLEDHTIKHYLKTET